MKRIVSNIIYLAAALLVSTIMFTSCKDDDKDAGTPIVVSKVYLEDASASVTDREVTFARLGQLIRLEGSGFSGLKRVYINGYNTYFNPVMGTDQSLFIAVSGDTPTAKADPAERNTIRLVKDATETVFPFEIRAAAPGITGISHTMPLAGENIIIYGSGLTEINKVVFPGEVTVTSGIVSDPDGEFCIVPVPPGISETGGSVLVLGANGGAYSPAYFYCRKNVILDFDGLGSQGSWGSSAGMIKPEDLGSAQIGEGNVSQGNYCAHRPARIASFDAGKTRCSEVWTAGNGVDDWRGQLTPTIPTTTALDQVAFQFDIYVPAAWTGSGFLKICLQNGFNGGEWERDSYNYIPWISGKVAVPFQTSGWTTVTIPFNRFYKFADGDFTFEDVLATREAASYCNFGFYFENVGFTLKNITGVDSDSEVEFNPAATSVQVYTDNWRVVSLTAPAYSDFAE